MGGYLTLKIMHVLRVRTALKRIKIVIEIIQINLYLMPLNLLLIIRIKVERRKRRKSGLRYNLIKLPNCV